MPATAERETARRRRWIRAARRALGRRGKCARRRLVGWDQGELRPAPALDRVARTDRERCDRRALLQERRHPTASDHAEAAAHGWPGDGGEPEPEARFQAPGCTRHRPAERAVPAEDARAGTELRW